LLENNLNIGEFMLIIYCWKICIYLHFWVRIWVKFQRQKD